MKSDPRSLSWPIRASRRLRVATAEAHGRMLRHPAPLPPGSPGGVQFLCLHHHDHDAPSLVRLIEWLRTSYDVVSYSRAIDLVTKRAASRPTLAISLDDGLDTHIQAGDVLAAAGVSACFFVCPSIPGAGPDTVGWFCRERLFIPPRRVATWPDIERLVGLGHEVGAHTMTHPDLASIQLSQAQSEIADARDELGRRIGPTAHFAWPYGRPAHITHELLAFARETGFESCASTLPGSHRGPPPDGVIRRHAIECHWTQARIRSALTRGARRTRSRSG